ncbi:tetratricopeptide repeat protein [Brachyspira hyodysenteriae]|uniref:tetratricopeptide repeat protein n=1 Tax=Brachyspira hyodysenteriae TaxID=159 RepID=UPI00069CA567|nr:tetratricopeptide repeat protein [Brachyspira hyodysenteriae]
MDFITEMENLLDKKELDKVIKRCKELIESSLKHQSDNSKLFDLALAYYYLGRAQSDYDQAIECYNNSVKYCDELIESDPNMGKVYTIRGLDNHYLEKYQEAVKDYDKAIELNRNDYHVIYDKTLSLAQLEEYQKSIDILKQIVDKTDDELKVDIYNNIGLYLYYLEDYKESLHYLNKSINLNKKHYLAYFNRGITKAALREYNEAIDDFNIGISINSEDFRAYYYRGILKCQIKNYEDAILDFDKMASLYINIGMHNIVNIIMDFVYNLNTIENIFNKLISCDNIWKNDKIFSILYDNDAIKKNPEMIKYIKTNLLYQYYLLTILSFNNTLLEKYYDDKVNINHYLTLNTLMILLDEKKSDALNSNNMRITNIITANDSKEGKILEEILQINNRYINIENIDNLITFQTSFSRNTDSLTMFRLYGKENDKEFTGASVIIKKDYFNDNKIMSKLIPMDIVNQNPVRRNLYWILYYNEKENILVFNPTDSKYTNVVIDLKEIDTIDNSDYKYSNIVNIIKKIFKNIFETVDFINSNITDWQLKNYIFSYLFENIKYVIKHEAFFEEQELRILIISDIESKNIQMDTKIRKLYVNYLKLFDDKSNYIKEIIVGSKVENVESIIEYIRKLLSSKQNKELHNIPVTFSKAPLR